MNRIIKRHKCFVCGIEANTNRLTYHFKKEHPAWYNEYKEQFGNLPVAYWTWPNKVQTVVQIEPKVNPKVETFDTIKEYHDSLTALQLVDLFSTLLTERLEKIGDVLKSFRG